MIPVIIVPILTEPERLVRLLASIDHPVGQVVVIDNGQVVDPFIGGRNLLPYKVHVIEVPHNLGVSASWNLGIKVTPHAPWWCIVNHDIVFGPGDLAALDASVNPGASAVYRMEGMAAFGVTYHAVRAAGFWDENFVPAYNEDLDWQRRAALAGVIDVKVPFTGTHAGSSTIYSDPVLRASNGRTHGMNDAYYAAKWGGPKQGGESFPTPFNRGGHVGDWRLDIERLRTQAWPKRTT